MSLMKQLQGFRLTTAEILYRLPDHQGLLQSYVWQDLDRPPLFPVLRKFLDFWAREIEGRIHSVRAAHRGVVSAVEIRAVGTEFRLHQGRVH